MDFLTKHGTHNNIVLKIVVAVLFIVFPLIGFTLGMQYQAAIDKANEKSPLPIQVQSDSTDTLKKYKDNDLQISFYYPGDFSVKEADVATARSVTFTNKEGVEINLAEGTFGSDNKPLKESQITVNGNTVPKYDYKYELDPSSNSIEQEVVQLSKSPPFYIRIMSWQTQPRRALTNSELDVFNSILATIKPYQQGNLTYYSEQCNLSVHYPAGWDQKKTDNNQKMNSGASLQCADILSPEYINNLKQVKGPGSAYMGVDVTISRTKLGEVKDKYVINNLDDYIKSSRMDFQNSSQDELYKIRDIRVLGKEGKSYVTAGMFTWNNLAVVEGNYIYSFSYPIDLKGDTILKGKYDKEIESIINSVKINQTKSADRQ